MTINWDKVNATTEADIERQAVEDGTTDADIDWSTARVVRPPAYLRAMRERLELTQAEFAARFGLNVRTIQDWEQGRSQPEGPASVLLTVIEREPAAVERALSPRTRPDERKKLQRRRVSFTAMSKKKAGKNPARSLIEGLA